MTKSFWGHNNSSKDIDYIKEFIYGLSLYYRMRQQKMQRHLVGKPLLSRKRNKQRKK